MNKKNRTSILLIVVIIIYGAIAMRFFLMSNGDTHLTNNPNDTTPFKPLNYDVQQAFEIINDYRDPFLGTRSKPTKKTVKPRNINKSKTKNFPPIHYLGLISDPGSSNKILSLSVKGKEYIARIGDEIEGVLVQSGNDHQLTVSFEGQKKMFNISTK